MANKFQLEPAVIDFVLQLSIEGTITHDDCKELQNHLLDTVKNLQQKGLSAQEAFEVAKMRLGNKEELVGEFQKVNGSNMLNKEWVFIFVGVAFTILIGLVLQVTKFKFVLAAYNKQISVAAAAYLWAATYLFICLLVSLLFWKGKSLTLFLKMQVFDRRKALAASISAALGIAVALMYNNIFVLPSNEGVHQKMMEIVYHSIASEAIIRGSIPAAVILSFFLSMQSVNKRLGWRLLFNSKSYIFIFILGFGVELLCAFLGRMVLNDSPLSAIALGSTHFACFMLFLRYNRPFNIYRTVIFLSMTIYVEMLSGYMDKGISENCGRLSSHYAWAVGLSVMLALFLHFLKKDKQPENALLA